MNLISLQFSAPAADDAFPPTKICPRCGSAATLQAVRCEACGRVYKTRWTPDPPPEDVAAPLPAAAPPEAPAAREDGGLSFLPSAPSFSSTSPVLPATSVLPPSVPTSTAPRRVGPARAVGLILLLLMTLWWLFPPAPRLTRPARTAEPAHRSAVLPTPPTLKPHDRPAFSETSSIRSGDPRLVTADGAAGTSGSVLQASSDAAGALGAPTLIATIKSGSWNQVNAALGRGEDVNQEDINGTSALMWATFMEWPEVVRLLLGHGARPNVRNDNDMSALDYAKDRNDIARLLRKAGARDEEPEVRSGRRGR